MVQLQHTRLYNSKAGWQSDFSSCHLLQFCVNVHNLPFSFHVYNSSSGMAAPLDALIQEAEQAHRLARAGPHNESTAFLISTQAGHSPHVSVHPPIKNVVVSKLKNSRRKQSKLSEGAHEAFNVFVSQSRSKPSEKAMKIIQPTDRGLPPLPVGPPHRPSGSLHQEHP